MLSRRQGLPEEAFIGVEAQADQREAKLSMMRSMYKSNGTSAFGLLERMASSRNSCVIPLLVTLFCLPRGRNPDRVLHVVAISYVRRHSHSNNLRHHCRADHGQHVPRCWLNASPDRAGSSGAALLWAAAGGRWAAAPPLPRVRLSGRERLPRLASLFRGRASSTPMRRRTPTRGGREAFVAELRGHQFFGGEAYELSRPTSFIPAWAPGDDGPVVRARQRRWCCSPSCRMNCPSFGARGHTIEGWTTFGGAALSWAKTTSKWRLVIDARYASAARPPPADDAGDDGEAARNAAVHQRRRPGARCTTRRRRRFWGIKALDFGGMQLDETDEWRSPQRRRGARILRQAGC